MRAACISYLFAMANLRRRSVSRRFERRLWTESWVAWSRSV